MSEAVLIHDGDRTVQRFLNIVASLSTPGINAIPVVNPDGSNISGGTASSVAINDGVATGQKASVDNQGNLAVRLNESEDVFGNLIHGIRNNLIEIQFDQTFDTNLITNTSTGTGTETQANGHALYSTGTGATASAKGVSVQTITYRAAHEVYAFFTAAFTTPTSAASFQRIGLYDTNNGFHLGYNGTTMTVAVRSGGTDTFTNQSSWNGDKLDGSTGSKFTSAGTAVAIDFTKSNVYRIRFGWLGSAPVYFEVLSPDDNWVVFHTIRFPNSQLNPSIQNPNLPMTIHASKTSSDATNLTIYTGCWGAGTVSELARLNDILSDYTLARNVRAVLTGRTTAGGSGYVNVKVNPSGALTTASSISDSNGATITAGTAPVGNESSEYVYPLPQLIKKQTFTINTSGDNTVYTPATGKAVKLLWYNITSDQGNSAANVKVILKLGTTAIDTQSLSPSQPFAHTVGGGRGFADGGANNAVVVNLSNGSTVYVNLEWLEY